MMLCSMVAKQVTTTLEINNIINKHINIIFYC